MGTQLQPAEVWGICIEPDEPQATHEFGIEYPRSVVSFWGSNLPNYVSRLQEQEQPEFGLYLVRETAEGKLYKRGQGDGYISMEGIQALSRSWILNRPPFRYWDTALPMDRIQGGTIVPEAVTPLQTAGSQ